MSSGYPLRASDGHNSFAEEPDLRKGKRDTSNWDSTDNEDASTMPRERDQQWSELANRGLDLLDLYQETNDEATIQESVACLREALSLSYQGIGDVDMTVQGLGSALASRFLQFGVLADLDEAIELFQNTVELRPLGHPNRYMGLSNLANALHIRFEKDGDLADLNQIIANHRSALELTPFGHPDHSSSLGNLGAALETRFDQLGDSADLDQALAYHQSALKLKPSGDPTRSAGLNHVATVLYTRFEHFGDRVALDQAVIYFQSALELRPLGHPDRAQSLNNLAGALRARFLQLGDYADLDRSIGFYQSALELRPPGHRLRFSSLSGLASALGTRFDHLRDLDDLDQAIEYHQSALEHTPPGHRDRSMNLNNLANALYTRFREVEDLTNLDHAAFYYQSALELRPPGHPDRCSSLNDLACVFRARFQLLGDPIDLGHAIENYQSAVNLKALGHPNRSSGLTNLAKSLFTRLERIDTSPADQSISSSSSVEERRMQVITLLSEASSLATGGSVNICLQASLFWVYAAERWSDPSVIEAYRASLGLMETSVAGGSTLESRHLRLTSAQDKDIRTLAVDGAACAIASNRITLALEFLEQGRSVLLKQAGQYRTQVDDLEDMQPSLAKRFRAASALMESFVIADHQLSEIENAFLSNTTDPVAAYQNVFREWEAILDEIRAIERFSSFLQPTPFHVLQAASSNGPVIVLNFSQRRTDAIIVLSDCDPVLVALPDATPELIADLSKKATHNTSDKDFKEVLRGIWESIVRPIVNVLLENIKLTRGSRLWSCPTGATSHLPLHAAGDYSKRRQNLPDLFISSYTSTLSALLRSREKMLSVRSKSPSLLVIGQSDVPNQTKLPCVDEEIGNIMSSVDAISILRGENGTRDSVLHAMSHHSSIHLACHGHVNQDKPFQSHFSLHDGPLSLLDITRQNLPNGDLAYLSACHSASGNRDRPDEVLHLAAGMQFAGFQSAVGTMWAVCDFDGPVVAGAFYASLLGSGGNDKAKSSAHALHRAVAALRRRPGISYSRWACFVHFGC